MTAHALRRVVLVGFMGAGKSSVGRVLARRLGWSFVDFDEAIEEQEGVAIREIFAGDGGERFRALEDAVARRLLERERVVLASGGGWGAVPGQLDGLPAGTETFWLQVTVHMRFGGFRARRGADRCWTSKTLSARRRRCSNVANDTMRRRVTRWTRAGRR